ncbi:MAG: sensor histidine kinase [Vagococcus sp.]|uniref:sensor histidine kinase n=2 Tax=Enterococcaceae TaxID=81852 RepID=UPI002FC96500
MLLIYGVLLSLVMSFVYLFVTWFRQKRLYQVLQKQDEKTSFEVIQEDESQLSQQIFGVMNQQHQDYYQEISAHKDSLDEHQTFMYQWVHQMKTPIAVLELMAESNDIEKNSVLEETDRLSEGLDLALNMARLESFHQDFIIEKVSLKKLMTQVVNEQKRTLIRNQVYPKVIIQDDLFVETDKKWLSFSLSQILLNSIKYTDPEETRLYIYSEEEKNEISLIIQDFGIGIQSEDLPKIFHPFFTGERTRKSREATGMGLYLVKKALDNLEHVIEVESVVGEGTITTIRFRK